MNLAVFLPNWIGDAAMATPALRAMRKQFAAARITGIARPAVADLLSPAPWLDDVVRFDPRSPRRELRSWNLVRRLRAARIDTAVLLTGSFRTALLATLAGARRRVGISRHGRSLLLTDRLRPHTVDGRVVPAPVIDEYLRLAAHLGCPAEEARLELATLPADERAADLAWQRLRLPAAAPVVALNVGGAYGPAKQWPLEYAATLARRMAAERNLAVLVLCGPQERDAARRVAALAEHPLVVSLANFELSLGLTKACIRRSDLLVTTDSGPRHIAAAFDVPVLTLFGPTHLAWSENHYPRAVHLQVSVPCGPCQKRACPLRHHRCMRELTVERVFAEAATILARWPRRAAA